MRLKEENERAGLKQYNIVKFKNKIKLKTKQKKNLKKKKIMASGPIASWQIEWENMALETYFLFLGSRITADIDGTHEITR